MILHKCTKTYMFGCKVMPRTNSLVIKEIFARANIAHPNQKNIRQIYESCVRAINSLYQLRDKV